MRAMTNRTDGPALNAALAGTGALLGAFSLLVSAGLLLAELRGCVACASPRSRSSPTRCPSASPT